MSGFVLVELKEEYEGVYTPDKKYDTKTSGIVVSIPYSKSMIGHTELEYKNIATSEVEELLGKTVYFEEYKDGTQIKTAAGIFSFIDIKDIRGYKSE